MRGRLTGVRCWTSRSEAEAGVLREMDKRCSWLSALGREPYMEGEKKLAEMLGRPMPSHRRRSSCKPQGSRHRDVSASTERRFCMHYAKALTDVGLHAHQLQPL